MTSSAINEMSGMSFMSKVSAQSAKTAVSAAEELSGAFQNAMNMAKDNGAAKEYEQGTGNQIDAGSLKHTQQTRIQTSVHATVQSAKSYDDTTSQSVNSKTDTSENDESKVDKTDNQKVLSKKDQDKLSDEAKEVEDKVVKEVSDKLDVSEEDVKEAMETLGLSFLDLADQSNMAALVAELTADGNSMALLTDENVFSDIVTMTSDVAELLESQLEPLAEEMGLDMSELTDLLSDATVSDDVPVSDVQVAVVETAVSDEEVADDSEVRDVEQTVSEQSDVTVDKAEVKEVANDADQSQQGFDFSGDNADASAMINPNNIQVADNVEGMTQTEVFTSTEIDTQDIIDQIAKYVRVNNGPDFSEVEMALNPASLGNIHLQVAAKEGVITATITTDNESVRDALLVQAMVLKEELNEQGLKVESVEVTVASHEFEQNMQDQSGESAKELYEQQVQKQTRRRIMLNGLEEAEELLASDDLTDAERIQIDMMAKNGSSMDVMV